MKNTFRSVYALLLFAVIILFAACQVEKVQEAAETHQVAPKANCNPESRDLPNAISSVNTRDGHMVLLRTRSLPELGMQLFLLTKIDPGTQAIIWEEQVGSLTHDFHYPQKIIQTKTGYAAVGFAENYTTGKMDAMLVLMDERGNWSRKFYETTGDIRAFDIVETDRQFLIIGEGRSNDQGDIIIITTNKKGGRISTRSIPKDGQQTLRSIAQTEDNGFIAVGTFKANDQDDVYLVKFDENFQIAWEKTFQYTPAEMTNTLINTFPNGYVLTFIDQDLFHHTIYLHLQNPESIALSAPSASSQT